MHTSISGYGEDELTRMITRIEWPRNHLDSVFVAVMGNLWEPGCKEAVDTMVAHTRSKSDVWMQEIRLWGFPEVDANACRDFAIQMAQTQGFEWLFLMDNDILPRPDTILKLMENNVSIVIPYYTDTGTTTMIGHPDWEPDIGLQPMRWVTTSAVLFRTSIFNCPGVGFKNNPVEGMFYLSLWNYGHRPYVDTDTKVELITPPTRPGDLAWDDRWTLLKGRYERTRDAEGLGLPN